MDFYSVKGLLSLIGVGLLFWHMREVRREPGLTLGRWLRYLWSLFVAVLITGASVDQFKSNAPITWYTVGGLVAAALLIVTMFVSIRESRDH